MRNEGLGHRNRTDFKLLSPTKVYGDPAWVRPVRPPGRCLAVVSRSRAGGAVVEALRRLRPLVTGTVQLGGAGHKVARVVDGLADLWLFPRSGTSRWDTCAAEAMLEAAGGVLADRRGGRICHLDMAFWTFCCDFEGVRYDFLHVQPVKAS